jgi:hypothetical protein
MGDVAWQLEHSVEADLSSGFAWSFWTDVTNWDDPPAQFVLDGSFSVGSRGTTVLPGQVPRHWTIREVRTGKSFIIEMPLDRATLSFEGRFDALSDCKTRLTQRIVLFGANAEAHAAAVQAAFGPTLAEGMSRIAGLMAQAQARTRGEANTALERTSVAKK